LLQAAAERAVSHEQGDRLDPARSVAQELHERELGSSEVARG
jgi:hypothetical protein